MHEININVHIYMHMHMLKNHVLTTGCHNACVGTWMLLGTAKQTSNESVIQAMDHNPIVLLR